MPSTTASRAHLAALAALGGLLGSGLRVLVFEFLPGAFPWAPLLVNLTGSVAVGLMLPTLRAYTVRRRRVAFAAVGVLGAYTTFSTFAVDVVVLSRDGRIAAALVYLGASLFGGVAAAALGHVVGRRS